jgi:hypothetical protein
MPFNIPLEVVSIALRVAEDLAPRGEADEAAPVRGPHDDLLAWITALFIRPGAAPSCHERPSVREVAGAALLKVFHQYSVPLRAVFYGEPSRKCAPLPVCRHGACRYPDEQNRRQECPNAGPRTNAWSRSGGGVA